MFKDFIIIFGDVVNNDSLRTKDVQCSTDG